MNYQIEELIPIVATLSEEYTSKESTSVPEETAKQLLEATVYCINEIEVNQNTALFDSAIPAKDAYYMGRDIVKQKVKNALKLYNKLISDFDDYGVRCLADTIYKGIPEFFKWYDIRFNPQDTILTLDYPVLLDYKNMSGIDLIYEYLRTVWKEQVELSKYDRSYLLGVLQSYNPNYEEMVENVLEIVRDYNKMIID